MRVFFLLFVFVLIFALSFSRLLLLREEKKKEKCVVVYV